MKKIQSLGKSLSRNEQMKIKGGVELPPSICKIGFACTYYEAHTGYVTGQCEQNSKVNCVCNAFTSSVVWSACEWEA